MLMDMIFKGMSMFLVIFAPYIENIKLFFRIYKELIPIFYKLLIAYGIYMFVLLTFFTPILSLLILLLIIYNSYILISRGK